MKITYKEYLNLSQLLRSRNIENILLAKQIIENSLGDDHILEILPEEIVNVEYLENTTIFYSKEFSLDLIIAITYLTIYENFNYASEVRQYLDYPVLMGVCNPDSYEAISSLIYLTQDRYMEGISGHRLADFDKVAIKCINQLSGVASINISDYLSHFIIENWYLRGYAWEITLCYIPLSLHDQVFEKLEDLEEIYLEDVRYWGGTWEKEMPKAFYKLTKMQTIFITGANETDLKFSTDLKNLTQLKDFTWSSSYLINIPTWIYELETVKSLSLTYDRITSISSSITKMKNLEVLDLSFNELKDLPNEITLLKNLQTLNIKGNQISRDIERIKKLQQLLPDVSIIY